VGTGAVIAIFLTVLVHLVGAFVLIWAMAGTEPFRRLISLTGDGDGDGGLGTPPAAPDPAGPRDGALPLPDADRSPVRLREPARIGDRYPKRPRRPEHAPEPQRAPERV
jgi:hypothetical protein